MESAVVEAHKLFKRHDQERTGVEQVDKIVRYHHDLDATIEKERLTREMQLFKEVRMEYMENEQLAFQEHAKHQSWKEVPNASRLPDIHKESEINTFLTVWSDEQEANAKPTPETTVFISPPPSRSAVAPKLFIRGEQGTTLAKRRAIVTEELQRCVEAFQLTKAMKEDREKRMNGRPKKGESATDDDCQSSLGKVCNQILKSIDYITVITLLYYDAIIDDPEGETISKMIPAKDPVIKFGLWVKVKEMTRSFTSLVFPDIEIRLDPKTTTLPKLPKAMGLSRENVAVRVVQLSFDPYSGNDLSGHEFYPLDCTLKVDLLNFFDRPKENGDWLMRGSTEESYRLHCEPYPPRSIEARTDPSFRISFDVPHTLVIRQPNLLIGKWVEKKKEWELCTHASFDAIFSGNVRVSPNPRRATFCTGELAHFAVIQEKVFDAPYESWKISPIGYDCVIITLEGRRRGDNSDREFRILVENAECRLLYPDEAELEHLRSSFYEPATLFRLLSQAGFNFLITDKDAVFLPNMTPKVCELEQKVYADIAQFSQYFTIASSKHNRRGEDPEMALFRVLKEYRGVDDQMEDVDPPYDPAAWYHVRYRLHNCVLSCFTEDEKNPNLNILEGNESHYNLYTMLLPLVDKEVLDMQYGCSNCLLRRCIYQILMLCRPISWG